jgi:Tfp pilus assembly protein PilF
MKRAFVTSSVLIAALLLVAAGCGSSSDLSKAETQRQFGVRMAKMNLWREARFRFQRALQIEPASAEAHSNLAVAYEATGDFDAALKEYQEALRLDRANPYIQKNYSRFVEFTQRGKKRRAGTPAAAKPDGASATTPAATAPPSPAPSAPPPPTDTTATTTTNPPQGGLR